MNYKIQIIRVIATLVVVFGHSIIIYTPEWNTYDTMYDSQFLCSIKYIINLFQMELFFFISGFCFFYSINKKVNFIDFAKNKIVRIIIPFLIIGILYLIPMRLLSNYPYWENLSLIKIVYHVILVHDCGHLWFLPVLFMIFVISYLPFKTKNQYIYILTFVISIGLYYMSSNFSNIIIKMIFHYYMFFILGVLTNKYKKLITVKSTLILLLISILCIRFYGNISYNLFVSITIVAFFYVFTWPNINKSILNFLDKNSFAIYLFHSPFIYFILNNFNYLPPIYLVSLNFFGSVAFSLLITYFIRKFRLNFIIGE